MTSHAAANEIDALELRLSAARERIRTLESENAILRNRADNAGHNVEALQEQVNALMEALEGVLATGLNGGNNVRLAFMAASQNALSDEDQARANASERAVARARAALAQCQEER